MEVLFCTSEAVPYAASGGLAEVSSALPSALSEFYDVKCSVVMPLYGCISQKMRDEMEYITSFYVPLAWRSLYCGVFRAVHHGVTYYFLDNEYYFGRDSLYGHYDDGERFAFFSRAILEMLPKIGYKPDVIHCNDWQTALVPVYYSTMYVHIAWYYGIKTVFTIHNIEYQGRYGSEIVENIVGVPQESFSVLDFDGCANFMKGGIESADIVTTVSPTYAREVLDPWFSYGLHPILRDRNFKVCGILNGIDTHAYAPKTDGLIYRNYSAASIGAKSENKVALRKRLSLDDRENVPMIAMVTRLVDHKGIELVIRSLERLLCEEDVQFVVLGSGQREYEEFFALMQAKYPGRVSACVGFVPELSHKIYAASDIFLMPSKSEPCGISQMIAPRYGSVPVVRETGGLADSIKDSADGRGNGFTFKNYDPEDMMNAIKRALRSYADERGWKILVRRAMNCDNSFKRSAGEYVKIYEKLTKID